MGDASTKPSGFVSALHPLGSFEEYNIVGHHSVPLVSVTLCCPGAHTFLTIALYSFTSFSFIFPSAPTTGVFTGGAISDSLPSILPLFPRGLIYSVFFSHNSAILASYPKHQFCNAGCTCTKSHLFETELNILNQLFLLLSFCEGPILSVDQGLETLSSSLSYISLSHTTRTASVSPGPVYQITPTFAQL